MVPMARKLEPFSLTSWSPRPRLADLLGEYEHVRRVQPALEAGQLLGETGAGEAVRLPRFVWRGPPGPAAEPLKLAVFGVVHGDEPAGAIAILEVLKEAGHTPDLLRGVELFCYPVCNPVGYERGTRGNGAGVDLNRQFWRESPHPEVQLLEAELRQEQFDGLVALHADCDSPGLYAFARGAVTSEELVAPALAAACGVLPRNTDAMIDGFRAEHGVIRDCYPGVLGPSPEQSPAPFEIILETPGQASLADQARAAAQALRGLLAVLPRLSVGGGEI
jgi:murein peptide amidase A